MLIWRHIQVLGLKFKFDLESPVCGTEEQHMDSVLIPRVDVYLKVHQDGLVEEGAWGWASAWRGCSTQPGGPSGRPPWFPPLHVLCEGFGEAVISQRVSRLV